MDAREYTMNIADRSEHGFRLLLDGDGVSWSGGAKVGSYEQKTDVGKIQVRASQCGQSQPGDTAVLEFWATHRDGKPIVTSEVLTRRVINDCSDGNASDDGGDDDAGDDDAGDDDAGDDGDPTDVGDPADGPCDGDPDTEALQDALRRLDLAEEAIDEACMQAMSHERANEITHSDGQQIGQAADEVDVVLTVQGVVSDGAVPEPPCETWGDGLSLCLPSPEPWADDILVAAAVMDAAIPIDNGDRYFQYGFVFDSDDDPDNNYNASPQYPNDFFDSTDYWVVISREPGNGWRMQVTDAMGGVLVDAPSSAHVFALGRVLLLVMARQEILGQSARMRFTTFWHQGDWGTAGGDWSGDLNPPIGHPLLPIPQL